MEYLEGSDLRREEAQIDIDTDWDSMFNFSDDKSIVDVVGWDSNGVRFVARITNDKARTTVTSLHLWIDTAVDRWKA